LVPVESAACASGRSRMPSAVGVGGTGTGAVEASAVLTQWRVRRGGGRQWRMP
jgi:hypothetical protein